MEQRAAHRAGPAGNAPHLRCGRSSVSTVRSWAKPLRRARRALRQAQELITEFVERPDLRGFTGDVHLRCAEVALQDAANGVREAAGRIAAASHSSLRGPRLVSAAGEQLARTVTRLALVTLSAEPPNYVYDAVDWVDNLYDVGLWVGEAEQFDSSGIQTLADLLTVEHPRIPIPQLRRRRLAPAAFAETPRRVSRGRAPPSLGLCPL